MKTINESKEMLPIDFLTQFISKGWDEVGNLKASIDGIKKEFSGTKEVENILQDLIDAYLIAIGQFELYLNKKDYVEIPQEIEDSKESLKENLDKDIQDEVDQDIKKYGSVTSDTKLKAERCGFKLNNNKVIDDVEARAKAERATSSSQKQESNTAQESEKEEVLEQINETETDSDLFNVDFPDAIEDEESTNAVKAWLNKYY